MLVSPVDGGDERQKRISAAEKRIRELAKKIIAAKKEWVGAGEGW